MVEKFKSLVANEALFYALLLILVSICSFGLGRLSVADTYKSSQSAAAGVFLAERSLPALPAAEGEIAVVASKSGSKYHRPECPGASQIKPANLIEFSSVAAAEAAGYTPAANCDFE